MTDDMAVMTHIDRAFLPHAHGGDAYLRAEQIACMRGERLVFSDLSFDLKAGEALMVSGANGSGKSSLLRLLAGFLPLAAGTLSSDILSVEMPALHYLGHADGLKPSLTLAETLAFETVLGQRVDYDLLALLGLPHHEWHYVGDLSAGQKRRLTLARLVLDPRPLWLLDEPLTALDADGRALIHALAEAHLARHGMIIAASHEPLVFADKVIELSGR